MQHLYLNKEQMLLGAFSGIALGGLWLSDQIGRGSGAKRPGLRIPLRARFKSGDGIKLGGVFISDRARRMHSHILGATGSGKTVCMEHILFQDIARGHGVVIVDPKGEREFFERVRAFCKRVGRSHDLHLLTATYPLESVVWNPCGLGSVSELQTKFFNSAIYSEPHYAKACEAALLRAFNDLIGEYPKGFNASHLVETLETIAAEKKEKNIEGLFYDLFNLANGEWAEILCCKRPSREYKEISLLDVVQKNQILFVDLPTEGKLVQSSRIGRLLTQEIILLSGLLKRFPRLKPSKPFSVFIDEFDAFGTESFISFLNKGRSSGFLITLAHQTLSDLQKISPTFEGQVLGNTNVRMTFQMNDPKDSETLSKLSGTQTVIKRTFQTDSGSATGAASNRETQEFRVHPDHLKDQRTGQCILHIKSENLLAAIKVEKPLALDLSSDVPASAEVAVRAAGAVRVKNIPSPAAEAPPAESQAALLSENVAEEYNDWKLRGVSQ